MLTEYSVHSVGEKLLTKGEVARLCRVDVRTVDRWLTAGKLACYRTPSGRTLFHQRDVLTVIARPQTAQGAQTLSAVRITDAAAHLDVTGHH
jgi:predicted site-specific integrase-resolvase